MSDRGSRVARSGSTRVGRSVPPSGARLRAAGSAVAETQALGFLKSTLAGGPVVSPRAVETLVAVGSGGLAGLDHNVRRLAAAAMMVAKARHGAEGEALALAEEEIDRRLLQRDATLPSRTLAHFWSAVSEAHVTVGHVRRGTQAARRAREHARDTADDALVYRALGLLAANLALNGEFVLAEEDIAQAAALETSHSWEHDPGSYLLRVGQLMSASARLDGPALAHVATHLRHTAPASPIDTALAVLAEAAVSLLSGRSDDGVAAITAITHGADEQSIPSMIRDFLVSYHATLLVSRGEPHRALALLDGRPSTSTHTVCFDLQRASAYLQLGDGRAALNATDGCLKLRTRHNLRTLTPIVLRRALAYERLGHTSAADAAFADAFQLMHRSGAATPLLTLPRSDIDALLTRFRAGRPDLAAAVDGLRRRVLSVPSAELPPLIAPLLTERETVIAQRLRDGDTLSAIARSLYVSPNTVKTQTASLYRKLGVTSRTEAVAMLERAGFFEFPR